MREAQDTKPYSKDLRLKVRAAIDRGMPPKKVAELFAASVHTIKRWLRRRRETSDIKPKPILGSPTRKGAAP